MFCLYSCYCGWTLCPDARPALTLCIGSRSLLPPWGHGSSILSPLQHYQCPSLLDYCHSTYIRDVISPTFSPLFTLNPSSCHYNFLLPLIAKSLERGPCFQSVIVLYLLLNRVQSGFCALVYLLLPRYPMTSVLLNLVANSQSHITWPVGRIGDN